MTCAYCSSRAVTRTPEAMCPGCACEFWRGAVMVAASRARELRANIPTAEEQAQMCSILEHLAGLHDRGRSNEERARDARDELIREAYAAGALQTDLAVTYGLNAATISRIVSGVVRRHRTSKWQNVPPETVAGIRQALHYGIPRVEIAKRYDVSLSLISKWYVWEGDKRPQRPTRLTPDVCAKVRRLCKQGLTTSAVARRTKLSRSSVYQVLRRQNPDQAA